MIDFNPKRLSPSMLLSSATHIYYSRVLQFKNASWMTDEYLVGELSSCKWSKDEIGRFS